MLAAEYQACQVKELNKAIRKNAASGTQRIPIGDTLKKSKISFQSGNTPEIFNFRVDAAKQLSRLRTYSEKKQRLLFIVGMDYPYSIHQSYFLCSSKTVTAARVYCILFRRGGVPVSFQMESKGLTFTHTCLLISE